MCRGAALDPAAAPTRSDRLQDSEAGRAVLVQAFRLEEPFLRPHRLDALQDLAERLDVDSTHLKKRELILKLLEIVGEKDVAKHIVLFPPSH